MTNRFNRSFFGTSLLILVIICFLSNCFGNNNVQGSSASQNSQNTSTAGKPSAQIINAETANHMMQTLNHYILIDVRTEGEFRNNHIPGAIWIPSSQIAQRAESELLDKDAVILVYCQSGGRARESARILAEKGYTQVYNMGGFAAWPYETASLN